MAGCVPERWDSNPRPARRAKRKAGALPGPATRRSSRAEERFPGPALCVRPTRGLWPPPLSTARRATTPGGSWRSPLSLWDCQHFLGQALQKEQRPSQVRCCLQCPALRTASTRMQEEGGRPPQHPKVQTTPDLGLYPSTSTSAPTSWSSSEPGVPQSPPASKLSKKPNSPCSPRGVGKWIWDALPGPREQGRLQDDTNRAVSGHKTLVTPTQLPTNTRLEGPEASVDSFLKVKYRSGGRGTALAWD
ncbi:PREDICTED: uncharacterized protein LOC105812946 [Propithecus coquereli]|uniref:uncharacterized protein LOC105812946 n=1 Tax=Propithecus coquereli TaxID=379532 RepID=UPI00063FC80C|nr:PREDICTED: uncharacterized protein LOC105812946 [Propithecus coquereli]